MSQLFDILNLYWGDFMVIEKTDAGLIIIGGGPAGLTAAQYGARANLKVLLLEQLAPGGAVLNIDVLENYPGNVGPEEGGAGPKTGFEFSRDLYRQALEFGASFLNEGVLSLGKEGDVFTVFLSGGETRLAPAVILASGAKHRALGIPGEEQFFGRGVSYCAACDGPFFKNKKIFVVGGGDAACDEAQYLSRLSDKVVLIHRRDKFRAQKALAERVLKNSNIEVRFNTRMIEIKGDKKVNAVVLEKNGGEKYEDSADAVFVFAGSVPQTDMAAGSRAKLKNLRLDEAGYIITDQKMASSVPGLYAAGDVRSSPFRQVVVAAAEGAIAAHCAAEYIDSLNE
jgi:thioredoxin reductase (NADPH)